MSGTAGDVSFSRGENPLRADKLNAAFAERVLRDGDNMTGSLLLVHDPALPFEAATKQYVDAHVSYAAVTIASDSPPGTPAPGQLWWESDTGNLFIYYADVNSSQWVQASSSNGIDNTNVSEAPLDGNLYGRSNAAWSRALPFTALSSTVPVVNGTGAAGSASTVSRADHIHPTDTSRYAATNPSGYQTAAQVTAVLPIASSTTPVVDGTAAVGVGTTWARSDHVHPTDTSRAPLASPALTGVPIAPTASVDTNSTQLATTAFVLGQAGGNAPVMDGAATVGVSTRFARQDHIHPSDSSRYPTTNPVGYQTATQVTTALAPYAPLASPTFTGTPAAPTAAPGTSTTQLASTAFVGAALAAGGGGASPSNANPVMDSTAAPGVSTLYARGDHVHPTDTSRYAAANPSGYQTAAQVSAVIPIGAANPPIMDGTAAVGASNFYARQDHVHPSDTSRAPLASPTFTGFPLAPTAPSVTNSTQLATTAFVQAAVAPLANNVGRNLLHNPLFNIQQRGVGNFTANGAYTADRWVINMAGDTILFGLIPPGVQAGLDEGAASVLRNTFTGTSGAGSYTQITQKIEKVGRLSGQTVTLSFMAQASAGGIKLGANLYQYFGSGGSPSTAAITQATGAAFSLTTFWTRYSATFVIPSISGKTLGTNGDDFTQLCLYYSSGSTNNAFSGNIGVQSGTIYVWGVQLEIGSVASPLEKPDPQQDLANCQRFFCNLPGVLFPCGSVAGPAYSNSMLWPVTMRATPSVALSGFSYGGASSAALGTANASSFYLSATSSGGAGTFASSTVNATADL